MTLFRLHMVKQILPSGRIVSWSPWSSWKFLPSLRSCKNLSGWPRTSRNYLPAPGRIIYNHTYHVYSFWDIPDLNVVWHIFLGHPLQARDIVSATDGWQSLEWVSINLHGFGYLLMYVWAGCTETYGNYERNKCGTFFWDTRYYSVLLVH